MAGWSNGFRGWRGGGGPGRHGPGRNLYTYLPDPTNIIVEAYADLLEVCGAVTRLAELSLHTAVSLHHKKLAGTHGEPVGEDGTAQQLIVIGMGEVFVNV